MHIALPPDPEIRRSAKIATVAAMMDCDVTDIYRMIKKGELETHGKGKRGIRVFLDSVARYQERQTKTVRDKLVPRRARAPGAAHRSAVAGLKAKGLL
jgi:hypothetical protein